MSFTAFPRRANKALGQHFLQDARVIEQLLCAIAPQLGQHIVEIGPGRGALTIPLLQHRPRLTVIEIDRALLTPLTAAAQPYGALQVIAQDVLTVDLHAIAHGSPIRLVGNLPYNLSSPIVFHALRHAAVITDIHFMLQKEVVDRLIAQPGTKTYGRLSVMVQALCTVEWLCDVPAQAFVPAPKVESAVVRMVPFATGQQALSQPECFAQVVRAAFGQRRKTLRNALAGYCTVDQLHLAQIDPNARAEQIAVAQFMTLANIIAVGG